MSIVSEIFSWWGGNTWGTRWTTWRTGGLVGEDGLGNRYYQQRPGRGREGPLGKPRRWVIYKDLAEASKVPPEWHGWLHHTHDTPPVNDGYVPKPWQKEHKMNMTGTRDAWRPQGSILASGQRPKATGDYKPWKPS